MTVHPLGPARPVRLYAPRAAVSAALAASHPSLTEMQRDPDLIGFTAGWKVLLDRDQAALATTVVESRLPGVRLDQMPDAHGLELFGIVAKLERALTDHMGAQLVAVSMVHAPPVATAGTPVPHPEPVRFHVVPVYADRPSAVRTSFAGGGRSLVLGRALVNHLRRILDVSEFSGDDALPRRHRRAEP